MKAVVYNKNRLENWFLPALKSRFPLEKTAGAMLYASQGHARGKVIIFVGCWIPLRYATLFISCYSSFPIRANPY